MARVRNATSTTASKTPRRRAALQQLTVTAIEVPTAEVAAEAYALFLERNGQQGDALGDWLAAERIVKKRRMNADAPRPTRTRRTRNSGPDPGPVSPRSSAG